MAPRRHTAICVFRDENRILVAPGQGDVKNERFFRPLGGAVEFGESAEEALHREICEEPGREIENVVQLGVIENRFECLGRPSRMAFPNGVACSATVSRKPKGFEGITPSVGHQSSFPVSYFQEGRMPKIIGERGITEALTTDRHFEQAGFGALLRDDLE